MVSSSHVDNSRKKTSVASNFGQTDKQSIKKYFGYGGFDPGPLE